MYILIVHFRYLQYRFVSDDVILWYYVIAIILATLWRSLCLSISAPNLDIMYAGFHANLGMEGESTYVHRTLGICHA